MPVKSKAQARLMHAAAEGRSKEVPAAVGRKFLKETKAKGVSEKRLPERKKGGARGR